MGVGEGCSAHAMAHGAPTPDSAQGGGQPGLQSTHPLLTLHSLPTHPILVVDPCHGRVTLIQTAAVA